MKKENQLITELCKFLDPDKERIRKLLDETEMYLSSKTYIKSARKST